MGLYTTTLKASAF